MPSFCPYCGIGFDKWPDYSEHKRSHAMRSELITPVRTTTRSKAEIVQQAEETWLQPFLVTSFSEKEHLAACRCMDCWNKLADKIIKEGELL